LIIKYYLSMRWPLSSASPSVVCLSSVTV